MWHSQSFSSKRLGEEEAAALLAGEAAAAAAAATVGRVAAKQEVAVRVLAGSVTEVEEARGEAEAAQ